PNLFEGPSVVTWSEEDIDGDVHPGMTVSIDSKLCSGDLYVSNHSRSESSVYFEGGHARLVGHSEVVISQRVLGARRACLSVVARDSRESVRGPIAYPAVDNDSTCR